MITFEPYGDPVRGETRVYTDPIHLVHTLFLRDYTRTAAGMPTITCAPPLCGPIDQPLVTTSRALANCQRCYEKDDRKDEWERATV